MSTKKRGILEQLRGEAGEKKDAQQVRDDLEERLKLRYKSQLLPKMQMIFTYLKEVIEHIQFLGIEINVTDYSERYPQFNPLTHSKYKLYTDNHGGLSDFDHLRQVNLGYHLLSAKNAPFSYIVESNPLIEQEIAFWHRKKVTEVHRYLETGAKNRAARFTVKCKIPVQFRFEVDEQATTIQLSIYNHVDFERYEKIYQPEQINETLMDELVRYFLRKDDDFMSLTTPEYDSETIRNQILAIQELYQREQAQSDKTDQPSINQKKLTEHLKALINGLTK